MANNNQNGNQTNGTSKRGFASMDSARQREIASKGGKASAEGDTSNRGFASMDGEKQRRIASEGGKASGASRRNNSMRFRGEMQSMNRSQENQNESGSENRSEERSSGMEGTGSRGL